MRWTRYAVLNSIVSEPDSASSDRAQREQHVARTRSKCFARIDLQDEDRKTHSCLLRFFIGRYRNNNEMIFR